MATSYEPLPIAPKSDRQSPITPNPVDDWSRNWLDQVDFTPDKNKFDTPPPTGENKAQKWREQIRSPRENNPQTPILTH